MSEPYELEETTRITVRLTEEERIKLDAIRKYFADRCISSTISNTIRTLIALSYEHIFEEENDHDEGK